MGIFESEVFGVFGIQTLVWVLALVVIPVRLFRRLRTRSARYSGGEAAGGTEHQSPTPSVVGRGYVRDGEDGVGRSGHGGAESVDEQRGVSPGREKWDSRGFDQYGVHRRTGTLYDPDGFDNHGHDQEGYDRQGYDFQGYNRRGSRRRQ